MERWRRHLDPEEMTPEERWNEIAELLTIMALPEGRNRAQTKSVLTVLKDDEKALPTSSVDGADVRGHAWGMAYWLANAEQRKFYRINQNRARAEREAAEAWAARRAVPLKETVRAIQKLVAHQASFWSRAHGWAPKESAALLSSLRLECYASLALNLDETLLRSASSKRRLSGRLILGWANLGSLLECTLQLFLGVWLRDYKKDERRVMDRKNPEKLVLPHELTLESLRVLFDKSIWDDEERSRWGSWISRVQQRRNAIHALKPRELGDWSDLEEAVRTYLDFLKELDVRLPKPDPGIDSNEP